MNPATRRVLENIGNGVALIEGKKWLMWAIGVGIVGWQAHSFIPFGKIVFGYFTFVFLAFAIISPWWKYRVKPNADKEKLVSQIKNKEGRQ